jgi:hypothetical protein
VNASSSPAIIRPSRPSSVNSVAFVISGLFGRLSGRSLHIPGRGALGSRN